MHRSCKYSFSDLFAAAERRNPTPKEKEEMGFLSHEERNTTVRILVKKAGWIATRRQGSDGKEYLAFEPPL